MRLISLLFCSSDPCSSPERRPHDEEEKPTLMSRVVQNLKITCSCGKKKKKKKKKKQKHGKEKNQLQEPIMEDSPKDLALKEWFARSPSAEDKRNCTSDGEDCGSKHEDGSACVSFSEQYSKSTVSLEELLNSNDLHTSVETDDQSGCYNSDSRDFSFSLEKLLRSDRKKVEVGFYSFTRYQSNREKKVSFRLPEVSDIIILNSPEENHKE